MDQRERWEDPQEALRTALDGRQAQIWTALPGIIQSRVGNNVTIQPAIKNKMINQKGVLSDVAMPLLIHCPLVMPGGGGFGLTLPVGEGDEVLVIFSSRCMDGWWQLGGVQPQVDLRMHDISDGFAIPACMSTPKAMPNISADTAQLRTFDGEAYVELTTAHIVNIVAPGGVNIIGPLAVTGPITATENITPGSGGDDAVPMQGHTHNITGDTTSPPIAGT